MESIIAFFGSIDFYQAIWLLPVVYIFHVLEELPRFADWAGDHLGIPYTREKFVAENVVLFSVCIGSVLLAAFGEGAWQTAGAVMSLAGAFGFFSNVIFHSVPTLRKGVYSPGVVTACLFFAPASVYIYYLAGVAGLLTPVSVILSIVFGLALLPVVVTIVHKLLDRGMTLESFVKKFALYVFLPPLAIGMAKFSFGAEAVEGVMMWVGPVLIGLPLLGFLGRRHHARNAA